MKVVARTATLVLVLGCLLHGGQPAAAADGVKGFKRHCALFLEVVGVRNGISFEASDIGSGCGDYFLRGVGLVTVKGVHVSAGVSDFDGDPSFTQEALAVTHLDPYDGFAFGTVNVHIPYRARCDRYRLHPDGSVRLVGSSRCSSSRPGEKAFEHDCTLQLNYAQASSGFTFSAGDTGPGCDQYVVRGVSASTTTGGHVATGLSKGDENPSADEELLQVPVDVGDGGRFAYGTANVYVPYRSRCDKYRLYPDRTVRLSESLPCTSATS
jgi:hypothetical protein